MKLGRLGEAGQENQLYGRTIAGSMYRHLAKIMMNHFLKQTARNG